jgi:predicted ATP-dependent endonuclease of OLD family
MEELVFVERSPVAGTQALQPEPVSSDEDFRVMTEFDAARSELFLAHAVVLVEGLTEKLVLPFVFAALGHDVDREAISIIECGGKPNIALFARICEATGIPFVVIHDSDRKTGGRLAPAERALNASRRQGFAPTPQGSPSSLPVERPRSRQRALDRD